MLSNILNGENNIPGLKFIRSGKVRNTYEITGHPGILLVVATDRISVRDFVLGALIPRKGEVLTAMNIFWRGVVSEYRHDLVSFGPSIDRYLPSHLQGNPELQKRATIVRKLRMIPIECIARGYLTGSGLASYKKDGTVCGHKLPRDLVNGSRIVPSIFTPTTKAERGHDEHIPVEVVRESYGRLVEETTLSIYEAAAEFARRQGIIIADTKIEVGFDPDGNLVVGDELLTPDSSRFWNSSDLDRAIAENRSPHSLDKQSLRDHTKGLGVDKLDPGNESHRSRVHSMIIDPAELEKIEIGYLAAFHRLTGDELTSFQRDVMHING